MILTHVSFKLFSVTPFLKTLFCLIIIISLLCVMNA